MRKATDHALQTLIRSAGTRSQVRDHRSVLTQEGGKLRAA